jgi:hypothetical protein
MGWHLVSQNASTVIITINESWPTFWELQIDKSDGGFTLEVPKIVVKETGLYVQFDQVGCESI